MRGIGEHLRATARLVVARLVVFETTLGGVVAQGQQQVVTAIVMRMEQRLRLLDQMVETRALLVGDRDCGGAVADHVEVAMDR